MKITINPILAAILASFTLAPDALATLTAHWTFDNNLNSGVGGWEGTAENNAAVTNTDGQFFIGSGALTLDGTTDRVQTDYSGVLGSNARTVSIWFKTASNSGLDTLVSYGEGSTNGERWDIRMNSGGLRVEVNGTGTNTSTTGYANSQWHNVMVSYAGGNIGAHQFYVDGKLVSDNGGTASINTASDYDLIFGDTIGGLPGNRNDNRDFAGQLDDAGFWDTALVATDAAILNGMGRINGIDLTSLLTAQDLWELGGTAEIGGKTWQKTSGLTGSLGDFGGDWEEDNAFIVLDGSGNGIMVIPEPGTCVLLGIAFAGLLPIRRRIQSLNGSPSGLLDGLSSHFEEQVA